MTIIITAQGIDYEWLLKEINHNLDNDKLRIFEILEAKYTLPTNYTDRMKLDTDISRIIKSIDMDTYMKMQKHLLSVTARQIGKQRGYDII